MMRNNIKIRALRAYAAALLGAMSLISVMGGCICNNKAVRDTREIGPRQPTSPGEVRPLYGVTPIKQPVAWAMYGPGSFRFPDENK